ncbi:MAG: holo-ACP synthase [Alphaproteobacteria bacterium]|jgi:holo-[acyl-carrier protein] synthase|nr:holo-ACP synthase [Alphaproteobacteria bacterium]
MIVGVGTDFVEIARIDTLLERFGQRFEKRCFTLSERAAARRRGHAGAYYAKRYAAKEAVLKALGTGFRGAVSWQDMEILSNDQGAPCLTLRGEVHRLLLAKSGPQSTLSYHLSLSDTQDHALAFVVIECLGGTPC